MKEMTSRQQQALATKQRIRNVAYTLLQKEPYERLSMTTIAEAAGVSVGTLYHYYASKEDLFSFGYQNFDAMLEELHEQITIPSSIEAIRAIVYAQTVGAFLRSSTLMSNILRIQLFTHSSLFYSQSRAFPQYILHHVRRAISLGELLPIADEDAITQVILRSARGSIFDCAVRNTPDRIKSIVIHDLDIILSHYTPNHFCDFPPVDTIWLDTYKQWIGLSSLEAEAYCAD